MKKLIISPKKIWMITCAVFLVCSAFAGGFAYNAVNRKADELPNDSISLDTSYTESYKFTETVTTKAPNTGEPVMTTAETTAAETMADETTAVETTTAETATAGITTVAETSVSPVTTALSTTTVPPVTATVTTTAASPDPEPVYPEDGDWNSILVNPWNPLPEGFTPELKSIGNGQQADYRVVDALNAMLNDCRKAGYYPVVCSSYRTIQRQQVLFENQTKEFMSYGYNREDAETYAAKWVARPGTSEHHTGLAFDIVSSSYQMLNDSQADTPEQKWLMANCHKYGFILRYPKNKTDITGINYEPWHYRYVGLDIAKTITEQQITFEEYLLQ